MTPNTETLYVRLGYSPQQADCIFDYLDQHRVEEGGRYSLLTCLEENGDEPDWFSAVVYSHPWRSPALKEESTIMCSFRFNTCWPGIDRVMVSADFDFNGDAVWAELAALEEAALGETIHGRKLSPKRKIAARTSTDEESPHGILVESVNLPRQVNLDYSQEDFNRLLAYFHKHQFPFRGRYDLPPDMRDNPEADLEVMEITVFSGRPFGSQGPRRARHLCSLRFRRSAQAIDLLTPAEGSDIETALDELAMLEEAALRRTIHGKYAVQQEGHRHEP